MIDKIIVPNLILLRRKFRILNLITLKYWALWRINWFSDYHILHFCNSVNRHSIRIHSLYYLILRRFFISLNRHFSSSNLLFYSLNFNRVINTQRLFFDAEISSLNILVIKFLSELLLHHFFLHHYIGCCNRLNVMIDVLRIIDWFLYLPRLVVGTIEVSLHIRQSICA